MSETAREAPSGLGVERGVALVDGVFAVVLTLLALDLHLPQVASNAEFWKVLYKLIPQLLDFVITFSVVAIFWYGHHMESHWIRRSDRVHILLTLLLLLTICFIPFSETLLERNDRLPAALTIYGANFVLAGLCRWAHWSYATHGRRLVDENMDGGLINGVRRVFLLVVFLYAGAIGLAWLSTIAALTAFALIPLLYIRPSPQTRRLTSLPRRPRRAR